MTLTSGTVNDTYKNSSTLHEALFPTTKPQFDCNLPSPMPHSAQALAEQAYDPLPAEIPALGIEGWVVCQIADVCTCT